MRYWIDLIEGSFEPSPYGYWISPDGDIYPVDDSEHENAIGRIENCSYGDAIATGWIRVLARETQQSMNIECAPAVTNRAIRSLHAIAKDRDDISYFVDTHQMQEDMDVEVVHSFGQVISILKKLQLRLPEWLAFEG